MKRFYIILILILMISCSRKNTITSNVATNALKGKVVNSLGDAIPDAEIVINYYLVNYESTGKYLKPDNFHHIVITKHQSLSDTVKIINDSTGYQSLIWDGTDLENKRVLPGYYDYNFFNSDSLIVTNKCLVLFDYPMQTGCINEEFEIITRTDSKGNFEISYDEFAFHFDDNMIDVMNENGEIDGYAKLSPYIKLWTFADEYYSTFHDSILINPTTGAYIEIEMD